MIKNSNEFLKSNDAARFSELRRALSIGLDRIEAEGRGIDDAAVELMKAGTVLSLVALGPAATLKGLVEQFDQLAREFPEAAARAEIGRSFPSVRGSA
jgi:hypothetical protein